MTDANGNTFTSVVSSVNIDGTIGFETPVQCQQGVACDFSSDITIVFAEASAAFQKSGSVAVAAGGDHDHDGDGVQDHAGKSSGKQQKSGRASAMYATEHASVGKQGSLVVALVALVAVVAVAVVATVRKLGKKTADEEVSIEEPLLKMAR